MKKISVVIITFNEEKNIEKCLKSVVKIADEIIVLDSFSTDKTEEICKKYNTHFIQHTFDGHIQQKNRVITHAQYDYLLSLDADELLSEELKKSINDIKNNWQYDAYYFNRLTNYCGKWIKHSGWYPDKKMRLWKKGSASWGGTNPHDKLILKENKKSSYIKGDLLHYAFHSIEQHLSQVNKFSSIKAEGMFTENKKANWLKACFSGFFRFFSSYFFKLGFLDGFYGLVISVISGMSNFLKYAKLKQLQDNEK